METFSFDSNTYSDTLLTLSDLTEIFPFEKTLIEFNANEVFNYSFMYLRDQYIIKQTIL